MSAVTTDRDVELESIQKGIDSILNPWASDAKLTGIQSKEIQLSIYLSSTELRDLRNEMSKRYGGHLEIGIRLTNSEKPVKGKYVRVVRINAQRRSLGRPRPRNGYRR